MSPRDLRPPTPRTPQQNDQDSIITPEDLARAQATAAKLATPQYRKLLEATEIAPEIAPEPDDGNVP